jgi:hypothetical protein
MLLFRVTFRTMFRASLFVAMLSLGDGPLLAHAPAGLKIRDPACQAGWHEMQGRSLSFNSGAGVQELGKVPLLDLVISNFNHVAVAGVFSQTHNPSEMGIQAKWA